MNCILRILYHLIVTKWTFASATYFHEHSYIEIQPLDANHTTDFGFSMGYWKKKDILVIGAPHHDLNGKVYRCPMTDIFANRIAKSEQIDIDMEKLAGDYSRELADDHHFCLGASISVATDFILTCAPLWRAAVNYNRNRTNVNYGTYGTCFVITDEVTRFVGAYEKPLSLRNRKEYLIKYLQLTVMMCKALMSLVKSRMLADYAKILEHPCSVEIRLIMNQVGIAWEHMVRNFTGSQPDRRLSKASGGSGWSTLIDESNNVTLISLSPFSSTIDIGYTNTNVPLDSIKMMNIYKNFGSMFKNIGNFVSGIFFEDKIITYALSARMENMRGFVAFLRRPNKTGEMWEVKAHRATYPLYIHALENEIGTMFGAALAATDLNSDGFSDLLVGAPAQSGADPFYYDSGALHIFLGGAKQKIKERRSIISTTCQGFFGTSIATSDVDGDGLSEIIVSAPFEDSGSGAVYIFNGREISDFVQNNQPSTVKKISDLKFTQRIQNKKYKWFGYSIQPLPDFDDNGCSEIAFGAPKSERVLLYRSMAMMHINLTAQIDREYVRQTDQTCVIIMNIDIKYPAKPENISESLQVSIKILGNDVYLNDGDFFELDVHSPQTRYEKNITVTFTNKGISSYIFQANVTMKSNEFLTTEVFNKSRVGISPHSKTTVSVPISRLCKDEDCVPELSSTVNFSASSQPYILGSSEKETVTITVLNNGNDAFESCVKIQIKGSEVHKINAEHGSNGWYTYMLPEPFERGATDTKEIELDMTKQSNSDEKLLVKVALHNICTRERTSMNQTEFPFFVSTKELFVEGFTNKRNITDTEISDSNTTLITDAHVYTVINMGSVTWKSINAEIKIMKKEFIVGYHISKLRSMICTEKNDTRMYVFSCNFDLEKYIKIIIILDIAKNKFLNALENSQLNTTSNFKLHYPLNAPKVNSSTTIFVYKVDKSFGQNKTLILVLAITLSVLILYGLVYVLYKWGFFKNAAKTKLEEMKRQQQNALMMNSNEAEGNTTKREEETNRWHRASASSGRNEDRETCEGHRTSRGSGRNEEQETSTHRRSVGKGPK